MKVQLDAKRFLHALRSVADACPTRTTMPILQHVRMTAQGHRVTLEATDQELGVVVVFDEAIAATVNGECMIEPKKMTSILSLVEGLVDLEAVREGVSSHVLCTTENAEYRMEWLDPQDFPAMSKPQQITGTYSANVLAERLRLTSFAAAREEGKYAMRGVLLCFGDDGFNAVATDGKRVAVSNPVDRETMSVLIPIRTANILEKACADSGDDVVLYVTTNAFAAETAGITITSRLVEGKFPAYRDIMPKKFASTATFTAGSFVAAIQQAAIMTDVDSMRVELAFSGGTVNITAQGPNKGKSKVRCKLDSYTGEPLTIQLNPQYITEALKEFDKSQQLTLGLNNSAKPVVFGVPDSDYSYLVVPMV